MTQEQDRVKKFMLKFGQECPDKPTQLNEQTAKLRASLILEEALETITKGLGLGIIINYDDGVGRSNEVFIDEKNIKDTSLTISFTKEKEVDLVELADGIADITVVSLGTSLAAGIDQEPINKDVFDSNDSKLWLEKDLDKAPEGFSKIPVGEGLYIVRTDAGKIAKPITYQPANPGKFIKKQLDKDNNQIKLF